MKVWAFNLQNNSLFEVHFFNIDMLRKKISSQFKDYLYQRLYCKTYFILKIFCQDECKTGHEETFIKILHKWRNNCLWRNTINVAVHISLKSIKGIVSRNVNLRDTAPLIRVKSLGLPLSTVSRICFWVFGILLYLYEHGYNNISVFLLLLLLKTFYKKLVICIVLQQLYCNIVSRSWPYKMS